MFLRQETTMYARPRLFHLVAIVKNYKIYLKCMRHHMLIAHFCQRHHRRRQRQRP